MDLKIRVCLLVTVLAVAVYHVKGKDCKFSAFQRKIVRENWIIECCMLLPTALILQKCFGQLLDIFQHSSGRKCPLCHHKEIVQSHNSWVPDSAFKSSARFSGLRNSTLEIYLHNEYENGFQWIFEADSKNLLTSIYIFPSCRTMRLATWYLHIL